jgi:hypothetical protein
MIAGSPAVSLVSSNPEGSHNHPAQDARALAQSRISQLLALEVAPTGRATADRDGTARLDPADERRKNGLVDYWDDEPAAHAAAALKHGYSRHGGTCCLANVVA